MKCEAYDGPPKPPEQINVLRMVPGTGDGECMLAVVHDSGEIVGSGNVATIGPDGLRLMPGLNRRFGFPLDGADRIKLVE